MYKHLLVATDGSKLSAKAVAHAIALAQALGGKLTAFYASPDYPTPVYAESAVYMPMTRKEYTALCRKEADKILKPISLKAEAAGLIGRRAPRRTHRRAKTISPNTRPDWKAPR